MFHYFQAMEKLFKVSHRLADERSLQQSSDHQQMLLFFLNRKRVIFSTQNFYCGYWQPTVIVDANGFQLSRQIITFDVIETMQTLSKINFSFNCLQQLEKTFNPSKCVRCDVSKNACQIIKELIWEILTHYDFSLIIY